MTPLPFRAPPLVFPLFGSPSVHFDPFGVRVDWSSLSFCLHSCSLRARYAGKGFESPILSSFSDTKLVSILAKKFLDLIFWQFMVFKMVF